MPLKLKENVIFSGNGVKLKEIRCERRIEVRDLLLSEGLHYSCASCAKTVYNTDFMSEADLEILLRANPSVCLFINKLNPIFEIEE